MDRSSINWHEFFTYDPATGCLTWKFRDRRQFQTLRSFGIWNTRYSGTIAGHPSKAAKAVKITLLGKSAKAHQVIWSMIHGQVPHGYVIDHINGNPFDNRLCNLRLATHAENMWNVKRSAANKTGFKGVTYHAGRFVAKLRVNKELKYLGRYKTAEEAYSVYVENAKKYHGEFARVA